MAAHCHLNHFFLSAFLPRLWLFALLFLHSACLSYADLHLPDDSNLVSFFQSQEGDQAALTARPSYVTDPLNKLIQRVPDLATLSPIADQSPLPMILQKVGENIDAVFNRDFSDVSANEFVQEKEWQGSKEPGLLKLHQDSRYQTWDDHYTYYVTRKSSFLNTGFLEYRLDKQGKQPTPVGFSLSNGFASSVLYFAESLQLESNFRYLGLARVDSHDVYVIAFAQISGKASISTNLSTVNSARLQPANKTTSLMQGIA